MKKNTYKLIGFDMDGTLLNSEKIITPDTIAAIREAGLGIAVGNATEELKKIAGAIVADNDHDGCAEAIRNYLM